MNRLIFIFAFLFWGVKIIVANSIGGYIEAVNSDNKGLTYSINVYLYWEGGTLEGPSGNLDFGDGSLTYIDQNPGDTIPKGRNLDLLFTGYGIPSPDPVPIR